MARHAAESRRASELMRCLQARLAEVKRLQRERNIAAETTFRSDVWARIEALESEIGKLRAAVAMSGGQVRS